MLWHHQLSCLCICHACIAGTWDKALVEPRVERQIDLVVGGEVGSVEKLAGNASISFQYKVVNSGSTGLVSLGAIGGD